MLGLLAILVAGVIDNSPATPAPQAKRPASRFVGHPHWVRQATIQDFFRAYPKIALRKKELGFVEIVCIAKPDGRLRDCVVASEAPKGMGFGKASLRMAPYYRLAKTTDAGEPVGGQPFTIPMRWRPYAPSSW